MLKRFFSSKITFFLLTTLVILTLNLTPLILDVRHAPAGRTFTLIHNNTQDYYFYLSLMNEGANGATLTYDPYTSEPHQSSIIFSYFVWLGKLSKLLGLPLALTYHFLRVILGISFLFFIFYFLFFIKVPYPRLAYLFFLFAAPFMHTVNDYGNLVSVPFMAWWNGVDPIRRAAFLPHHMMGGLLLVLSIILIFKYIITPARSHLVRLILISAVMAFVHTPSLLIILLIIPPSLLIYYLINISNGKNSKLKTQSSNSQLKTQNLESLKTPRGWQAEVETQAMTPPMVKEPAIGLLIYWVTGLLMLLIMVSQTRSGFPWSQYIDWEKNLQFPLNRELIGALGILLPFSAVGIYSAIKSKKFENIFIVCWLIIPLLFIPIAPKLNLSNIRLIQGMPYLPLSILAILGINTLIDFVISTKICAALKHLGGGKLSLRSSDSREVKEFAKKLILTIALFLFMIFTFPTLKWSLKDQIREYWPIYGNVYLDNRLFSAFDFINNNFPAKTITLSTFYSGNYLPAYTNTVSFIGHFGYTYDVKGKEKNVQKFFEGKMSVDEVKNFLSSNKIALVFQGPEEKPLYKDYLYPEILKPVYDKEEVTIYPSIKN